RYRTEVRMLPEPTRIDDAGPRWELRLLPGEATMLEVVIAPRRGDDADVGMVPFRERRQRLAQQHERFLATATQVSCSNVAFASALAHDLEDVDALRLRVAR